MMCSAKIAVSMAGPICRVSGAYNVHPPEGAPPGRKKTDHQKQGRRNQQPEAEVVHSGKRHVTGADLQRDHPVCKTHKARHDGSEHHDDAVHGGELVEQFRVDELQARLKQLSTDHQCHDPAKHQHGQAEQHVHRADVFVVGGVHPATPARRGMVVVVIRVPCGLGDLKRRSLNSPWQFL